MTALVLAAIVMVLVGKMMGGVAAPSVVVKIAEA